MSKLDNDPWVTFKSDKEDNKVDSNRNKSTASRRSCYQRGALRTNPRVVVDLGADLPMACPATWHAIAFHQESVKMYGAYEDDSPCTLQFARAVMAVDYPDCLTIIIGVEKIAWIQDYKQKESLLNSHHMRNAAIDIDNCLQIRGGQQKMTVGRHDIPLDFVDNLTISFSSCLPTDEELNTLSIFVVSTREMDCFPQQRFMSRCKSAKDATKSKTIEPICASKLPPPLTENISNPVAM